MGLLEVLVFLPGLVSQESLGPYQGCLLVFCILCFPMRSVLLPCLPWPLGGTEVTTGWPASQSHKVALPAAQGPC